MCIQCREYREAVIIGNAKNEKLWGKRQSVFTYLRNVWGMGQADGDTHYKMNCWI